MRNLEREDEENCPGNRKNPSSSIGSRDKQLESLLLTAVGVSHQALMIALQYKRMSLGSGISSVNYSITDIRALPSKYKIASTSTMFEMFPVKQNERQTFISMTFHRLISHHIICFLNIGLKRYDLTSMCYQWKVGNKIRDGSRASRAHQTRKDEEYKIL